MSILDVKDPDLVIESTDEAGNISLIIKDNKYKLGDVLNSLPHGIIDKTVTGIGATTLEIKAERNSIIIVPLKIIAASKVEQYSENCFYVGSPINNFKGFKKEDLMAFISNENIPNKKIIAVAESTRKVVDAIGEKVYADYFLMIDEIDTIQESSSYRNIESCLDYYLKFPIEGRAMVTATMIPFSHPLLKEERKLKINYKEEQRRNISELVTAFYPLGTCIDKILKILTDRPKEKIVIAYNAVAGSKKLADKLVEINQKLFEKISILCSPGSKDRAGIYFSELLEDKYPNQINFITSAYFSGYDIYEKYHLISIINTDEISTKLSYNTLKQIAGRGRDGLLSEIIICPAIFDSYQGPVIKAEDLIKASESEIRALRCIDNHLKEFTFLKQTLDNIRNVVVDEGKYFGFRLVRRMADSKFNISYFNIDAYLEKQKIWVEEQNDTATFMSLFLNNGGIDKIEQFVESKYFISKSIIKDTQNIINGVKVAADKLRGVSDFELSVLLRAPSTKIESELYKRYSVLEKYFKHKDILIDKLVSLATFNNAKYLNFHSSISYKSLSEKHPFRLQIEGSFELGIIYSSVEIQDILKTIYAFLMAKREIKTPQRAVTILNNYALTKKVRNIVGQSDGYKIISFDKQDFEKGDGILNQVLIRDERNPFMEW